MRKVLGGIATLVGVLLLGVGILAKPVLYDGLATVKLDQRSESQSVGSGMSALYAHDVDGKAVFDKLEGVNLRSIRDVVGIPGKARGGQEVRHRGVLADHRPVAGRDRRAVGRPQLQQRGRVLQPQDRRGHQLLWRLQVGR